MVWEARHYLMTDVEPGAPRYWSMQTINTSVRSDEDMSEVNTVLPLEFTGLSWWDGGDREGPEKGTGRAL